MKIFFEVELWISAILGLTAFWSALIRWPSGFRSIGRKKWRWVLITAFGLTPYLGIVPALIYLLKVKPRLPASSNPISEGLRESARRSKEQAPTAPYRSSQGGEGYNRRPASSTQQRGSASPLSKPSPRIKIACGRCGATGWMRAPNGSTISCTAGCNRGYFLSA